MSGINSLYLLALNNPFDLLQRSIGTPSPQRLCDQTTHKVNKYQECQLLYHHTSHSQSHANSTKYANSNYATNNVKSVDYVEYVSTTSGYHLPTTTTTTTTTSTSARGCYCVHPFVTTTTGLIEGHHPSSSSSLANPIAPLVPHAPIPILPSNSNALVPTDSAYRTPGRPWGSMAKAKAKAKAIVNESKSKGEQREEIAIERQLKESVERSAAAGESLLAGIVAGIITRTSCAPLTTIKTLFQLQAGDVAHRGCSGIFHAMRHISRNEGLTGLWKGNFTGCCRLAPYFGFKFAVFDHLKCRFGKAESESNTVFLSVEQTLLFGGIAGVVATMATYPIDLIQVRQIFQNSASPERAYCGIIDALRKIHRHEGPKGLFKGACPSVAGVIPYEGVQFAVYEALMRRYQVHAASTPEGPKEKSIPFSLLAGSVAGALGQTIAYPLDVVRARLAVQSTTPGMAAEKYRGTMDCIRTILSEEGARGLFKGNLPNLISVLPRAAIMFGSYETAKRLFCGTFSPPDE